MTTAAASTPQIASVVTAYLRGAEIQAEDDAQRRELHRALSDILEKPSAELRTARYAGADGRPGQLDLLQLLRGHLVPSAPQPLDAEDIYADKDRPDVRAAVREKLSELDRLSDGMTAASQARQ